MIGDGGKLYAVQTFACPGTPQDDDAGSDPKLISAAEQLDVALKEINRARRATGRLALGASQALSQAARNMLPRPDDAEFEVERNRDLYEAVPPASQSDWAQLTAVVASCGGCGTEPVRPDVTYFTGQWLGDSRYREMLMKADATHLGFAIAANGRGKKIGVGLLGRQH